MTQQTPTNRSVEPAVEPTDEPATPSPDGSPSGDPVLELDGITKSYATETAVQELSLAVGDGEILALLGPSGCGKTTTLRLIGGLERPDSGTITLDGRTLADAESNTFVPPQDHGIGLVFQDFALFPHMTAAENVAFGLADRSETERERRVEELLELVGLADHADHHPDELSGGQKQRIALARSLAPEPEVLLLDEPLSNLDISLRVSMREEIRDIIEETGVTAVWVTHDQEEAMSVADRIGVMNDGQLRQVGAPETIFARPTSRFVASFLGQAGFLSARVEGETLATDVGPIDAAQLTDFDADEGECVDILVRPDDLQAVPTTDEESADGRIVRRQYQGPAFVYQIETASGDTLYCLHNHTDRFETGAAVAVELVADHPLSWYPGA